MKPEDNRTWSSLLTRDMVVKVLLPLSIFAALSGTFPTDATLLQYLEQSQGLTEEAAVALVSIKTYSTLIFIAPVVLLTLAYGARLVMFSGALSQLVCLGFWAQSQYFGVAQLCCVFAGYGAAAGIACICYGRYLLQKEYFLLYCALVGSSLFVGQFVSTLLEAFVQDSLLDPFVPFYVALVGSSLAILVCFLRVPTQQYVYTLQGAVNVDAGGPRLRSLMTCDYWRQMGADFIEATIGTKTFTFLIVWYTFEYAIFLSIQATIVEFFSESGQIVVIPVPNGFVMAFGAAVAAVTTAAPLLLRIRLYGNRTEQFIVALSLLSSMFLTVLQLTQTEVEVGYLIYLVFINFACFQLTAALAKIVACVPYDVSVVLYGAIMLVATGTKIMLTSLFGLTEAYIIYVILWIAFSLLLSIVVLRQFCLMRHEQPVLPLRLRAMDVEGFMNIASPQIEGRVAPDIGQV